MTIDQRYDNFIAVMKASKCSPPYMSKTEWMKANGITPEESTIPLQITPKHRDKIGDHCKVVNQIRETRSKRKKEAAKKPAPAKAPTEPKPKKPRLTEEEKRERKRNYMKKWRKDNPKASYESVKRWRENHPEQHRTYNRNWKRNRAKQTAATLSAPTSGTTTTKQCGSCAA